MDHACSRGVLGWLSALVRLFGRAEGRHQTDGSMRDQPNPSSSRGSGGGDQLLHGLARALRARRLAWPVIHLVGDEVQVLGAVHAQVGPLGKYCRSNPSVFSLVPRCQGLEGSEK